MKTNKVYITLLAINIFFICSCIESFTPEIKDSHKDQYVISGFLDNHEGFHYVTISKTSPISEPEFIPISGCSVEVMDDDSNIFEFTECDPGKYRTWIDQAYLEPGKAYKLNVVMQNGDSYETEYIIMPSNPSFDSLYYIREKPKFINPHIDITLGVRFYLDFNGTTEDSKYLRWDLTETWEYYLTEELHFYVDRVGWHFVDDIYRDTVRRCWKTKKIETYFNISTKNLTNNNYKKFKLHYVDNHTQRLMYGYYLEVVQYAITKDAFYYWKQLEDNSVQSGGLYEKQPVPIKGNIYNTENPEMKALGFFEVSSTQTKIIFLRDIPIKMSLAPLCYPLIPDPKKGIPPVSRAILYVNEDWLYIEEDCWNCLARGGKNHKPDFWPIQ